MKFPGGQFYPFSTIQEDIQSTLKEYKPRTDFPTIPEFYANQEIFLTGATGFIGKVLIEKLLRSCPDIKTIYVLMRPRKSKSVEQRINDLINFPLFEVLKQKNAKFFEKIIPVSGDMAEIDLGLSKSDIDRLQDVSIIFHSAASVRFDDPLKKAVLLNTRGTREIMKLAEHLKNLKVVMHVSTTYSNNRQILEEKLYPSVADWEKTIEICEKLDEKDLDPFYQHYIGFMPNTYIFSKNLAEQVSNDYSKKLPVVVFRPSVIVGSFKEPLQGWVDNTNGPMGILLVSALGFSKTMICDPKNVMDIIPVDICVKAMVIAAWKHANENSLAVYNCAQGKLRSVTIKQLLDMGISTIVKRCAFNVSLSAAGGGVTKCATYNLIRTLYYHLLPAILVDFILRMQFKKPKIMKIQRKIFEANKALSYFVTHDWEFANANFIGLSDILRNEDLRKFDFMEYFHSDVTRCIFSWIIGMRRFLRHDNDETLERSRKKYEYLLILNKIGNVITYFLLGYLIFFTFGTFNFIQNLLK